MPRVRQGCVRSASRRVRLLRPAGVHGRPGAAVPPETVVTAARAVTGGGPKASRAWRMARDRSHLVVEVDLGFRRKAVFTLRHGETVPDGVVKHSLLGSKRRK